MPLENLTLEHSQSFVPVPARPHFSSLRSSNSSLLLSPHPLFFSSSSCVFAHFLFRSARSKKRKIARKGEKKALLSFSPTATWEKMKCRRLFFSSYFSFRPCVGKDVLCRRRRTEEAKKLEAGTGTCLPGGVGRGDGNEKKMWWCWI